jgi:hypothetical protein
MTNKQQITQHNSMLNKSREFAFSVSPFIRLMKFIFKMRKKEKQN